MTRPAPGRREAELHRKEFEERCVKILTTNHIGLPNRLAAIASISAGMVRSFEQGRSPAWQYRALSRAIERRVTEVIGAGIALPLDSAREFESIVNSAQVLDPTTPTT